MSRYTLLAISGLLGAGLICSVGACGSDEPADDDQAEAGRAGANPAPTQNFGMGGRASAGSGVSMQPATAGMASAGMSGRAGAMAGNGSAGRAGGGAGGMGGGGAAGTAGEEDIFGGLFGPGELSCEGLLCFETADCANFYPDEMAACKFTACQDFVCQ